MHFSSLFGSQSLHIFSSVKALSIGKNSLLKFKKIKFETNYRKRTEKNIIFLKLNIISLKFYLSYHKTK
jgi:hypothetical protein